MDPAALDQVTRLSPPELGVRGRGILWSSNRASYYAIGQGDGRRIDGDGELLLPQLVGN